MSVNSVNCKAHIFFHVCFHSYFSTTLKITETVAIFIYQQYSTYMVLILKNTGNPLERKVKKNRNNCKTLIDAHAIKN